MSGLSDRAAEQAAEVVRAGGSVFLAHLLRVASSLVGELLIQRLLQQSWPELFREDGAGGADCG